ncbi:PKD domain-containing protein [Methanosarcina sp. T3]|uniref:PKD domain-containing protein n=1 Tax=Methanosarcina sp. T3 TaxID=3439062 RepID=UPI003F830065
MNNICCKTKSEICQTFFNGTCGDCFTDTSEGTPNSWYWDFGDGDISDGQNPIHTYLSAGNYTVCLTVSNVNGMDSKLATIGVI